MRTRGGPPKSLTGQVSVRADRSPWWERVESELLLSPDLLGKVVSSEELAQMVPCYPDGRRPRARTAVRRLRRILELVERGPEGSLSRGATFRIVSPTMPSPPPPSPDDSVVETDTEWLDGCVERMVGRKRR